MPRRVPLPGLVRTPPQASRPRERWEDADRADEDEPVRQPNLPEEPRFDVWQKMWESS